MTLESKFTSGNVMPAEIEVEAEPVCNHCGLHLQSFSGMQGIPAHLYCPICMDLMYDVSTGEIIGRLE
jgi:hypothetical protein